MKTNSQGASLIKLSIVLGLIVLTFTSTMTTSKSYGVISQLDKKVRGIFNDNSALANVESG